MGKLEAAKIDPWRQSFRNPRYWVSWLAGVAVIGFVSIPAERRWGEIAGLATFITLFVLFPLRILLETAGRQESDPPFGSLE
jgi:hypothetical protein